MKPASGELKKLTARATSLDSPRRPTGIDCASFFARSESGDITLSNISVSAIGPGATTLTVMPYGASSSAQVRAMPMMPALVAE
jgi:hypothetical protein